MLDLRAKCASTLLLAVSLLIAAGGCARVKEKDVQTADRLRIVIAVYLDYAASKGVGPKNEQQLRKHLRQTLAFTAAVETPGIDDTTLLRSSRDGLPFVIHYGLPISLARDNQAAAVVYEQRGEEGTRFVAFANGVVQCVEENASRSLLGSI